MLPQADRFRRSKLFRGDKGTYSIVQFPGEIQVTNPPSTITLSLVFTDHAPLTRGSGVGALATISDVFVRVDGVDRIIQDIDPLCGIIYVVGAIDSGSSVEVDYFWTKDLVTPFTAINDPNQTLNQWHNPYSGAFTYSTLSLPGLKPQPQINGYRYRMLERAYSSLLNDPTLMVFNEDSRQAYANRLETSFQASSTVFEGDRQPTDPLIGFVHQGPALGVVDALNRFYLLTDGSSSNPITGSLPNFFRKAQPLNVAYKSVLNFRFRLDSWQVEGDWTGFSCGWADAQYMVFLSALDVAGFTTMGLLTQAGDESHGDSYIGRILPVEARTVGMGTQNDVLVWDAPPPFVVGTRLLVGGLIVAADVITQDMTQTNRWLVQLSTSLPNAQDYMVFVEVDHTSAASYRIEATPSEVRVFRASSSTPLVVCPRTTLAITPEVYGALIRPNEMFWGCLSRRAETTLALDFIRYVFTPINTSAASFTQKVRMEGDVLPEDEVEYPWTLVDNEGFARIVSGDFIQIQEAGKITQGGFGYVRYEPYLNSNTIFSGRFRVRVHSWALGSPAQVVISDGVKELTLALWEDPASLSSDTSSALALLSKGLWSFPDAISLQSKGHLVGATNLLTTRFLHPFSGTDYPEAEGWASTFKVSEQGFIDDTWILKHTDGIPASAIRSGTGAFGNYVHAIRFKVDSYEPDPLNFFAIPFWWGLSDGTRQVYLTLCADGANRYVAFCSQTGQVLVNGSGPLRRLMGWDDSAFHNLRVLRNGDFVSLYIDDLFDSVFDISDYPPPSNSNESSGFFVGDQDVQIQVDYFFTHSQTTNPRRIGLFEGGDYNDIASYNLRPLEWFGTFAELEVFRDPQGSVLVYANGSQTPLFDLAYEQLPATQARPQISTLDVPYVLWGSFDPRSYSETLWDYFRYDLTPRSERLPTLNANINNWANVITSSEPLLDTTAYQATLVSDTQFKVRISQLGRNPERVLSVSSLDGAILYSYYFQKGDRDISILGSGLPLEKTPVVVTYLEGKPWTANYLRAQPAVTRLNEGTPIVPLGQLGNVRAELVPDAPLDVLDPPTAYPGERYFSDGKNTVRFVLNQPRPYYEALEIYQDSKGETGYIAPACDQWVGISLDTPYADAYVIPAEGGWGSTALFYLGSSLLNSSVVLHPGSPSPVRLTLNWLNVDTLGTITDEFQTTVSTMVDVYGAGLLNNPLATLNNATPVIGDPLYVTSAVFTLNNPGIPTTYPINLLGPVP